MPWQELSQTTRVQTPRVKLVAFQGRVYQVPVLLLPYLPGLLFQRWRYEGGDYLLDDPWQRCLEHKG